MIFKINKHNNYFYSTLLTLSRNLYFYKDIQLKDTFETRLRTILFGKLVGKDLFGNEYSIDHGKRLSGPFGDELVVGAYLSKLFFLS